MSVKVTSHTITKSNQTPQILAALKRAGKSYVTVGVHNDSGQYGKGGLNAATPAKVALWLEWGTSNMPRRPFLAPSMTRNKNAIAAIAARSLAAVAYTKATVGQGLATIGAAVVSMIQNTIKSNVGPALSGSWSGGRGGMGTGYLRWRRKHYPESGERTLIASGLLFRSVRFVLHLDGAAKAEAGEATPLHLDAHPEGKHKKVKGPPQAGRDEFGRFLKKTPEQKAQSRELARQRGAAMRAQHRAQKAAANADPEKAAAAFNNQKRAYVRADKKTP